MAKDHRVWALFVIYGACFGIELTINNVAALYYHDRFGLSIGVAGLIAGLYGTMNIFARTLGGFLVTSLESSSGCGDGSCSWARSWPARDWR